MRVRKIITLMLSLILISAFAISANAASVTNDGITAEIIADNNYYEPGETAKIVVKVTNNNDFAVENVSVESLLPDDLEVVGDSKTKISSQSIEAGDTVKFTLNVKTSESGNSTEEIPSSTETTKDNQNNNTKPTAVETNSDLSNTTNKTNNSDLSNINSDSSSNLDNPNTGFVVDYKVLVAFAVLIAAIAVAVICYKKKKLIKMLSLSVCIALLASSAVHINAIAENEQSSFDVTESIRFGEKTLDVSVVTKYSKIKTDDSKTYTRGEWAKLISEIEGITADAVDYSAVDWFYGDTKDTEDGLLFEHMYRLGIIPAPDNEGYTDAEQDVALFEADKKVTREYAAYTAVKALGFREETPNLTCSDADEITYKSVVTTALKFNMFELIDGSFRPNELIGEADKNQILAVIKALDESLIADEDETVNELTFSENTVVDELVDLTDYKAIENGDGTYTVTLAANETTTKFVENTVFVLPANESFPSGATFKVKSVSTDGDSITAVCTIPEMSEVADAVYMKDTVAVDMSKFVPEDGVSATVLDSSESSGDVAPIDLDKDFENDVKLKMSTDLDENLSVSVTFSLPRISVAYKSHVDWDWLNTKYVVDEFLCVFTAKTDIDVEGTLWSAGDDIEKKLGTLPINLPAGFVINVNLYAYLKADATISIGYSLESTFGVQYVNGSFRDPSNSNGYLSKDPELGGSFAFGPKVTVNFTWTVVPQLIGVEVATGIAGEAKITNHSEANLTCINLSLYLPLELSLSHDSVAGEVMKLAGMELSWTVFDADNSCLKMRIHIENLKVVDECTFGRGAISVVVNDSDNQPLPNAFVVIRDDDNDVIAQDFTNAEGKLTVNNVEPGQVVVEIKATGYKKYTSREIINTRQTTYMEAVLMVLREGETDPDGEFGVNVVSGNVTDAVTGNAIDASFVVRSGINADNNAEVICQGQSQNGEYSVTLPYGYYTITFSKDGYVNSSINVVVKLSSQTFKSVVLSPELSSVDENAALRIVLTWGEVPSDLDSHLLSNDSSEYHIYFSDKDYYDDNDEHRANLDVDDISSYGPETITVYSVKHGEKFSYYVHDYTNRDRQDSTELSNSGARVAVYSGDSLVAVFNTPIDVEGNLWHVFDYDPENGTIMPINTYSKIGRDEFSDYFIDEY